MGIGKRELFFILLVFLVVVGAALYFKKIRKESPALQSTPNPQVTQNIENKFKIDVPDNLERAELKDVSGGTAMGLVTREKTNNGVNLTILADVTDPAKNQFYQVWLEKDGQTTSLGKMTVAKGGYLLDAKLSTGFVDYQKIIVTLEKKFDKLIETKILEGSF